MMYTLIYLGGSAKRNVDSSFHFVNGSSISIVRTRELNACQHALIKTCVWFFVPFSTKQNNGKHIICRNISIDRLSSITILFVLVGSTSPVCRFPLQRKDRDRYFEIESGNETRRPIFGTSASLIIASVDYSLNYPMCEVQSIGLNRITQRLIGSLKSPIFSTRCILFHAI